MDDLSLISWVGVKGWSLSLTHGNHLIDGSDAVHLIDYLGWLLFFLLK